MIRFREESDWPLIWNAHFNPSQDSWLPATDYPRASRSFPRIAGSGNEIGSDFAKKQCRTDQNIKSPTVCVSVPFTALGPVVSKAFKSLSTV